MDEETLRKARDNAKYTCIFIILGAYYFTVHFLSRDRPTINLDDFQVSSLNKTSLNSLTKTTTIYFDLKIKNENSWVGVYYDNPLNLTISYFPPTIATSTTTNTTNVIIVKKSIQGFYQGNGKVKHVIDSVVVEDLFSESEQQQQQQQHRKLGESYVPVVGPVKVVSFKVVLNAKIKFKSIENKKLHVVVGGDVDVNGDTGSFLLKKSVQLKYAYGSNKWGVVQWLLFFPLIMLFGVAIAIVWGLILMVLGFLG